LLARRHQLGSELRRLREQSGLSGRDLAGLTAMSQSKVSRIESGKTMPTLPEVTSWAGATEATASVIELLKILMNAARTEVHSWADVMSEQAHLQDSIQALEGNSARELTYEPSVVPGLLQTAEYARRLFTIFDPPYPEENIPAAVVARLDRQATLFNQARRFEFVLTEAALRFRFGPPSMMIAQLDRISSLSTLENVDIGLIPADAAVPTHVPHGFVLLEGIDGGPEALVLVETVHANLTVNAGEHVDLYRRQWSKLKQSAVFDANASDLFAIVASDARKHSQEGQ
jgi:transcriptional regulator with XRE-family HTH domain